MRKTLLFILVSLLTTAVNAQVFVVPTSSGANDGTSWADGYTDLQTAIFESTAGDTIWVAQGSYKPFIDTLGLIPQPPTSRTFWLKNGVVVYGGFNGTETSLSQRDPFNLKATLEGEITPGVFAENVVKVYSTIDSTAILDGFIIQNGKSNDTSAVKSGAGMLLYGDAGFYNLHFKNNEAKNSGGGIYSEYSSSIFVRCRFSDNTSAQYDGAACDFVYGNVKMYNCIYDGNHAGRFGGALVTIETDLLVQNGTFVGNTAGNNIFQFSTSGLIWLNNCIFNDDNLASDVLGTSGGVATFRDCLMPNDIDWLMLCPNCFAGAPTFTNASTGDYSLMLGSSGINETLTVTPINDYTDYAGNPRLIGPSMDLGAFENQIFVGISGPIATVKTTAYPSPTTAYLSIETEGIIESISIRNMAGQVVQTETTGKFSVENLPVGMYFIQVKTANGNSTARFIKA